MTSLLGSLSTPASSSMLKIAVFMAIAIGSSLLMAYIPARQAARVPIAEALRYE